MITDNFNRTSLGTDWQTVLGAAWTIASNRAKPTSTFAMTMMRRAEGNFPDDQYSQAQCQAVLDRDSSLGGVAVRVDATGGNAYYAHLYSAGVLLYKRSSTAGTSNLAFYSMSVSHLTFYLLKLVVTGGVLQVYVNGSLVISATDTAPLSSGKPGLFASSGTTPPSFDDFECTDAVSSGGGGGGSGARGTLLGVG